jgi:predicted Rdx family selenoprotein
MLVKGKTGDFEVTVDGALKFSKQELGRFPTDDETVDLATY